jgi:hypothetical protein
VSVEPERRPSATFTRVEVPAERAQEPAAPAYPSAQSIPPGRAARYVAACSYLGIVSLLIVLAAPTRRFVMNHARTALALHLMRFLWIGGIIIIYWLGRPSGDETYTSSRVTGDLALLISAGLPRGSSLQTDILPWIAASLVGLWLLALVGIVLALVGRTADMRALVSADWNDVVRQSTWWANRAAEERRRARRARQRQLERLQRTTKVMGVERERTQRRAEIDERITRLQAEREHINQLLALGEVSQRRYDSLSAEIDAELLELRLELSDIFQRSATPRKVPEKLRASRLDRAPESMVETIAIVTPSGVPLFTYGFFHLDEALVAGILSAFDSISEEVFGSRVHKTALAEGQVLYFAHGEHVVVLAIFTDEPSPRQVEQLRTMLQQFELANAGPLARQQYDPNYLHEVQIPFRFSERT